MCRFVKAYELPEALVMRKSDSSLPFPSHHVGAATFLVWQVMRISEFFMHQSKQVPH